jgi:hypothetical protein
VPRALAKALTIAPKLTVSAKPLPMKVFERSPSGALEEANALTPSASRPKPSDWANITST